jgi:hypothetical protein
MFSFTGPRHEAGNAGPPARCLLSPTLPTLPTCDLSAEQVLRLLLPIRDDLERGRRELIEEDRIVELARIDVRDGGDKVFASRETDEPYSAIARRTRWDASTSRPERGQWRRSGSNPEADGRLIPDAGDLRRRSSS